MPQHHLPQSSGMPGHPATQLSPHGLADLALNIQAAPDELADLSHISAYADSDTYHRPVYLLYENRKGAISAPGGPRWMIGWPIYTDPSSDVWRLLFSVSISETSSSSSSRSFQGMTTITVTRHFVPRAPNSGWGRLSLGNTTLEQRKAIETIAAMVGTKDRKKDALMNSAQWVECVLTQVERHGVLDPQVVRSQIHRAKTTYT